MRQTAATPQLPLQTPNTVKHQPLPAAFISGCRTATLTAAIAHRVMLAAAAAVARTLRKQIDQEGVVGRVEARSPEPLDELQNQRNGNMCVPGHRPSVSDQRRSRYSKQYQATSRPRTLDGEAREIIPGYSVDRPAYLSCDISVITVHEFAVAVASDDNPSATGQIRETDLELVKFVDVFVDIGDRRRKRVVHSIE